MQETPQPGSESGPSSLKCKEISPGKSAISLAGLWVHWQARRKVGEQQAAVLLHIEGRNPRWLAHWVTKSWEEHSPFGSNLWLTYSLQKILFIFPLIFFDHRIIFNLVCSQMPRTKLLPREHAAPSEQFALVGGGGTTTQRQSPTRSPLSQASCSPLFCLIHSLLPSPQGFHPKHLLCF